MIIINALGRAVPAARLDRSIDRLERLLADLCSIRDGRRVDDAQLRDSPVIENWGVSMRDAACLVGNVTGHPEPGVGRGDRGITVTSDLWVLDEGRHAARTLSRWYRLGAPLVSSTMGEA